MTKIRHFIVLMLENRSFDHIFGFAAAPKGAQIESLLSLKTLPSNLLDPASPESNKNPSFQVSQPAPFAVHDKEGPSHSFNSVNIQLSNNPLGPSGVNRALNIGFAKAYANDLVRRTHVVDRAHIAEVMQCFSPDQLPSINQLASEFCLCDRWHCEVPGPTMPNRMFIHAATSEGYIHNDFTRPFRSKTVYELFEEKGLTWATYFQDLNEVMQFQQLDQTPDHFRRFDSWPSDVEAGRLPNYIFILPRFINARSANGDLLAANSQHAPEDARFADHLIADVYEALANNPEVFRQAVLVVTYDEHGGFYDHVIPGAAQNPDGQDSPNPDDQAKFKVASFAFDRIGLRVPTIIVSPWIPKGIVEHRFLQHTSVIKTVTEIFELNGPLNNRDNSAQSFADLFERLTEPRATEDIPKRLDRVSLDETIESVVAGVPMHPADEPLDSLTEDWVSGMLSMIHGPAGTNLPDLESVDVSAQTQGQAADAIQSRLRIAGL